MRKEFTIALAAGILFVVISLGLLGFYYYKFMFPFTTISLAKTGRNVTTVSVKTLIPVRVRVEYGALPEFMNSTMETSESSRQTTVNMNNLLPDVTHYFKVTASDAGNRVYQSKLYVLE